MTHAELKIKIKKQNTDRQIKLKKIDEIIEKHKYKLKRYIEVTYHTMQDNYICQTCKQCLHTEKGAYRHILRHIAYNKPQLFWELTL